MENTIKMYDGKVYGIKVSNCGLENGYLESCGVVNGRRLYVLVDRNY